RYTFGPIRCQWPFAAPNDLSTEYRPITDLRYWYAPFGASFPCGPDLPGRHRRWPACTTPHRSGARSSGDRPADEHAASDRPADEHAAPVPDPAARHADADRGRPGGVPGEHQFPDGPAVSQRGGPQPAES